MHKLSVNLISKRVWVYDVLLWLNRVPVDGKLVQRIELVEKKICPEAYPWNRNILLTKSFIKSPVNYKYINRINF